MSAAPCKTSHHVYRKAKAKIRLRVRALSRTFPVLNRIIGYHRRFQYRANARMTLCACMGWLWICASCTCWKTPFAWCGPYITKRNCIRNIVLDLSTVKLYRVVGGGRERVGINSWAVICVNHFVREGSIRIFRIITTSIRFHQKLGLRLAYKYARRWTSFLFCES